MIDKLVNKLKYSAIYEYVNWFMLRLDYLKWFLRGKTPPTPHLIKQSMVINFAKSHHIKTFVETGTYLGAMVLAVKDEFSRIYTIELNKKLYLRAKNKFEKYAHIKVYQGDSAEVLPTIVKDLKKPTLYWLDAHYSKGITSKTNVNTPIKKELGLILDGISKNSVILIDDANYFNGRGGYPDAAYINSIVQKKCLGFSAVILNNVFVIFHKDN